MLDTNERRGGRPPLEPGKRSTTVPVRLGPDLHDRACRIALRRDISVAEVTRRALRRYDPDDDDD